MQSTPSRNEHDANGGIGEKSGNQARVLRAMLVRQHELIEAADLARRNLLAEIAERKRVENALRESEQRYRLVGDAANDVIWDWNLLTDEVMWNEGVRSRFGYATDEVGPNAAWWYDHIHPDDRERVVHGIHAAIDGSKTNWTDEYRYLRADGSAVIVLDRGRIVRDETGKPVRMVGSMVDLTERVRAEETLRQSEERLRALTHDLEARVEDRTRDLVRSQGELRELATELNLAEQRERKRIATELHDNLQQTLVLGKLKVGTAKRLVVSLPVVEKILREMDELFTEALTYSRTLVSELSPPALRDHGLAAGLKWLAEYMNKKHGQNVTMTVLDDTTPALPEDQGILLFQSVRELLVNSSKHAGTGKATVTMKQCDGNLVITVSDDGIGFDHVVVDSGMPSGGISSKFGLFSIQERMRALGGSFDIQSACGKGTSATLTLPLLRKAVDKKVPTRASSVSPILQTNDASRETPHDRHSLSVLLVDDHTMVRQGLRSVLDAYADIRVVGEARDGAEAVKLVDELKPHAVVMDINMPRMNGIDATTRIKARRPETIVIGISVNAGDENSDAMKRAGAATLLTKEAALEELYGAIQDAASGRAVEYGSTT